MSTSPEPRVSVVMPAYNAGRTIEAAVKSVLRQTMTNFELIVIDDGSRDDTVDRLSAFRDDPRVKVLHQANAGPSAARNAAIEVASAPVVSVIDSDDLWVPTYLEAMEKALASQPEAGFAYTDAWLFEDELRLVSKHQVMESYAPATYPPDAHRFLLELLARNFVYTSVTVSRCVLREVGGYDERLHYGEDFELWLRIVETGRIPIRAPGTLAIHRKTGTSLTADVRRFYCGICTVYELVLREHPLEADGRAVAERRLRYWRHQLSQLDSPGAVTRSRQLLRRARRRMEGRRRWLPTPPSAVGETLAECGVT